MRISLKLKDIPYGDLAMKLLPALENRVAASGTARDKLLTALTRLPEDVIRSVLDSIPPAEKNEIVSLLAEENQGVLLGWANALLKQKGIGADVTRLALTSGLELQVDVENIDYTGLIQTLMPVLRNMQILQENPAGAMLSRLLWLPVMLVKKTLDVLPQEKKDDILLYLINSNQSIFLQKLTGLAAEHGIALKPESITAAR